MTLVYGALIAFLVSAGLALAQQASPAEQVGVLAARLNVAETEINNAYLALIRERTKAAELAQQVERWKEYARPLYAAPASSSATEPAKP